MYSTPPGNSAQAFSLSDDFRIAGRAKYVVNGPWRAYVTDPEGDIPLPGLGTFGGLESEARDVSTESGTVGWAHNASNRRRAFYVQHGATALQPFNELPRLAGTTGTAYNSEARSVNRLGQVVGRIQNDSGSYRAFVYTPRRWQPGKRSDIAGAGQWGHPVESWMAPRRCGGRQ
ncbi:MAG: hypothetical protein KF791_03855 [Verrucomicrobiae bacterium]|nr:hypothetical protein [Verrucomicrobiae bacterium]